MDHLNRSCLAKSQWEMRHQMLAPRSHTRGHRWHHSPRRELPENWRHPQCDLEVERERTKQSPKWYDPRRNPRKNEDFAVYHKRMKRLTTHRVKTTESQQHYRDYLNLKVQVLDDMDHSYVGPCNAEVVPKETGTKPKTPVVQERTLWVTPSSWTPRLKQRSAKTSTLPSNKLDAETLSPRETMRSSTRSRTPSWPS